MERSARQQQRATFQPVEGTDFILPSFPPSANVSEQAPKRSQDVSRRIVHHI